MSPSSLTQRLLTWLSSVPSCCGKRARVRGIFVFTARIFQTRLIFFFFLNVRNRNNEASTGYCRAVCGLVTLCQVTSASQPKSPTSPSGRPQSRGPGVGAPFWHGKGAAEMALSSGQPCSPRKWWQEHWWGGSHPKGTPLWKAAPGNLKGAWVSEMGESCTLRGCKSPITGWAQTSRSEGSITYHFFCSTDGHWTQGGNFKMSFF